MAARQRWARERWPELEPGERPPRAAVGRRAAREPVTDEVAYYEDSAYEDDVHAESVEWLDETDDGDRYDGERERYPVANPYAIVALAAALLLMFPVAVVFGLLAFGHPRGKLMATTAVLLGVAEVAAVIAIIVLPGNPVAEMVSRAGNHLAQRTETIVYEPSASSSTEPPAPTVTIPVAPPATTTTGPEQPAIAESGATCARAGLIGTTDSGTTLLCLSDSSSSTDYRWAGPYRVAEEIAEAGTDCDGNTVTARTADGRALVCEKTDSGGIWTLWTSR
ncbi:hypothetical protein [Nocardia paucivorans]|uniref:hypothetical protein n=1 Tax=Nocardia paucivorans TaxID=114259 RepID=UPI00031D0254|nr:hypothetical protein [Nocardia paucivorans]